MTNNTDNNTAARRNAAMVQVQAELDAGDFSRPAMPEAAFYAFLNGASREEIAAICGAAGVDKSDMRGIMRYMNFQWGAPARRAYLDAYKAR